MILLACLFKHSDEDMEKNADFDQLCGGHVCSSDVFCIEFAGKAKPRKDTSIMNYMQTHDMGTIIAICVELFDIVSDVLFAMEVTMAYS